MQNFQFSEYIGLKRVLFRVKSESSEEKQRKKLDIGGAVSSCPPWEFQGGPCPPPLLENTKLKGNNLKK